MKTALVIMAAGMGSRFGGGIKQLEPVGPNGEIIMDYSIHDAIEAGFNKVVFIIRKDIKEAFHDAIGKRIEGICNRLNVEFTYAYQELDDLAVINADDYYGKEAFVKIHEFLINNYTPERSKELCMAGFILGNTLSDNGTVTRGICAVDENDYLTDVMETYEIKKTEDGAESQGNKINVNSHVSMNMWGLTPEFVGLLEEGFVEFFENIKGDEAKELKGEYLLPIYIDELLKKGKVSVKLLETQDKWFGVTYKEDKPVVVESFAKLIADGVYRKDLFSDLQA